MAGLSLFLLKSGSRNQMNHDRSEENFTGHYHQMFGHRLPHMDRVNAVLKALPNEKLEQVKMDLMSNLFEQKWLREYRLLGKYYLVAVDATGVVSFDKPHCEQCLTKKSKNKILTYFHYVLEAKLITSSGFAISLAGEWIENPEGDFDKQDCERKAFVRLADKLKKQYPRLPVCILADGLYPYENAFKICEDKGWKYIFVLQEDSLKTVREELTLTKRRNPVAEWVTVKKGWRITDKYRFQTDIEYHKKYILNWLQCEETQTKKKQKKTSCFEYVTNIKPNRENVKEIVQGGRLRWKIENEGFNAQKCGDYELEHKFCRKSYNGLKNYYSLLQIAHVINQLVEKGKVITDILKLRHKETIRNLWSKLKNYMIYCRSPVIDNVFAYERVNANRINPAPT